MTALAAGRSTPVKDGVQFELPVKGAAKLYPGGIACLDATNFAVPGTAALKLRAIGRVEEFADNSGGADGDITVKVRKGCFRYANSAAGDAITLLDVKHPCYIVDDQTVAKTDNGGTRSVGGTIIDVDADGVWVLLGTSFGEARDKAYLQIQVQDLVGANAKVYGVQTPYAGDVTKIASVLSAHALATGDATLTSKIEGVGITTGVITITQAGSAVGDKDSAVPTAANAVVPGNLISITVGGTNDNAAAVALVIIEITLR